jgi:hypothetical protein
MNEPVRLIYKSCQIQLTAIKSVIDIDTVASFTPKKKVLCLFVDYYQHSRLYQVVLCFSSQID